MTILDQQINRRWRYTWHALSIIEAKRHQLPLEALATLLREHSHRIRHCLAVGLSWDVIIRHQLDDPRRPESEFAQMVVEAVERRRTRLHSQQQAVQRRLTQNVTTSA